MFHITGTMWNPAGRVRTCSFFLVMCVDVFSWTHIYKFQCPTRKWVDWASSWIEWASLWMEQVSVASVAVWAMQENKCFKRPSDLLKTQLSVTRNAPKSHDTYDNIFGSLIHHLSHRASDMTNNSGHTFQSLGRHILGQCGPKKASISSFWSVA